MFVQFHQVKEFLQKNIKLRESHSIEVKKLLKKHNGSTVSTELFISLERYEEIKSKYDSAKKKAIYFNPL